MCVCVYVCARVYTHTHRMEVQSAEICARTKLGFHHLYNVELCS